MICGIVAMSIGSSWTTAGTIGVGLVGIATMLGVSPAITAGAVISGAYLGDKLSPLSETTILTAQMVGSTCTTHIKRQVWTSVPAFVIAAGRVLLLGSAWRAARGRHDTVAEHRLAKLDQLYNITPLNLLPLALLVVPVDPQGAGLAWRCIAAALFAGFIGAFTQPDVVARLRRRPDSPTRSSTRSRRCGRAMATGFSIDSGIADIDRLLSRGGMDSMLLTLWLIIGAVTFGTMLEEFGLIDRLIDPMIAAATSTGRLFLTVFVCGFGLNIIAGDQYIALVLPSRIFRAEFAKRGLAPTNLSRLAADSGTVTSPLVPWNSCGAFMGAVLGSRRSPYLPFCFFNIVSPLLSVLYGFTGFKIEKSRAQNRRCRSTRRQP